MAIRVHVQAWMPPGGLARLGDVSPVEVSEAEVVYGLPPLEQLAEAKALRWVQLTSAGVPWLCTFSRERGIAVTNLAGLYGSSIAELAFGLLAVLARNLQAAIRNQERRVWDRDIAKAPGELRGKTIAVVGLGDIGRSIARLGRAYGMRVVGCRRREGAVASVDEVYPASRINDMLAEADIVAVAAPLTASTQGMIGPGQFAAMKAGVHFVNVSRGPVVQEAALVEALRSGRVAAAGLDVFEGEPLPADSPLWGMSQVVVVPHVAGEVVNTSDRPLERFRRNLANWRAGEALEGAVDLEHGY